MLTDNQINKFKLALEGVAPAYDPNWAVTQELLKLITIQAQQLINLQAQLDAMTQSNTASSDTLITVLQQSMNPKVASSGLTESEVASAAVALNKSIESAVKGEKALKYAGNILKFVAKVAI
jgi:hypothetical protein